jgi:hypothetical protein
MHPVIGFEVLTRKGHQNPVAWMIQSLDTGDPLRELGTVLIDVIPQFGFGVRRPSDQKRSGVRQRFKNPVKELLVDAKVSAAGGVGLVMQVLISNMRMKDGSIDIRGVKMEDFRLAMVNPDNGVVVLAHNGPCI